MIDVWGLKKFKKKFGAGAGKIEKTEAKATKDGRFCF